MDAFFRERVYAGSAFRKQKGWQRMDDMPDLSENERDILRRLKELRAKRGEVDPAVEDDLPVLGKGGTVAVMFKRPSSKKQDGEQGEGG